MFLFHEDLSWSKVLFNYTWESSINMSYHASLSLFRVFLVLSLISNVQHLLKLWCESHVLSLRTHTMECQNVQYLNKSERNAKKIIHHSISFWNLAPIIPLTTAFKATTSHRPAYRLSGLCSRLRVCYENHRIKPITTHHVFSLLYHIRAMATQAKWQVFPRRQCRKSNFSKHNCIGSS